MGGLREVAAPFVVPSPLGVAIRTSLKQLSAADEKVLRLVGDLLGSLASRDLKARCSAGLEHDSERWAERKRVLTRESSSRWAGSITKASHDQWALARRGQLAHIQSLQAGIDTITHRLSRPLGEKGTKQAPGGYRSEREWHAKRRRLCVLEDRLQTVRADREAGLVTVVRGGKRKRGSDSAVSRPRLELLYARVSGSSGQESSLEAQEQELRATSTGTVVKVVKIAVPV